MLGLVTTAKCALYNGISWKCQKVVMLAVYTASSSTFHITCPGIQNWRQNVSLRYSFVSLTTNTSFLSKSRDYLRHNN